MRGPSLRNAPLAAAIGLALLASPARADESGMREWYSRARLAAAADKHDDAVAACDELLKQDPKFSAAYQLRGEEQFKRGKFHESVVDFQKYLELNPSAAPGHWQLGISYYYDGQFAAGAKQFEAYQNVDDNDVENVVWRFLCQARAAAAQGEGIEKARAALFKVKLDRRVPMMEVYRMFKGELQPDDVLKAAEAGASEATEDELRTRRFNANLYVGLYYEALGKTDLAKQHITEAHEKYSISHYMGDVARVHAELLEKPAGKK